jgi:hypothetical protein
MIQRKRMRRVALFAVLAIAAAAVFGVFVMSLWNWLVPELFGGRAVTFWQAIGLLVLSRILFGGFFRGQGHGGPGRYRIMERWEQMTPEEREKFRQGMRRGCGVRGDEREGVQT